MIPFILDMETSDPDDFLTLLFLLGHPQVDLRAVTITPGTWEQVGLVRQALAWFDRSDITVGTYNIAHPKDCVSRWHYKAFPQLEKVLSQSDYPGWEVLENLFNVVTTLVCGAPLKNLGALLSRRIAFREAGGRGLPGLGRAFIQGGFAGEGVVPPEKQLEKFRGRTTCPTFNLNGDPESTLRVLNNHRQFQDLRFVSKNVCHGVRYDSELHARFEQHLCASHQVCNCPCHTQILLHDRSCCDTCPRCGVRVSTPLDRTALSQTLIHQGMTQYLAHHPDGKAFHDPLAACCAIDPSVGEWAEVELYRSSKGGEWGSYLLDGSGVRIITGYDPERFVRNLLGGGPRD